VNDVTTAIGERLAALDGIDVTAEPERSLRAILALREAARAVVDLHCPREPTQIEAAGLPSYERGKMVCTVCMPSGGALGPREVYPCRTVRAIMGMIGVKEP
jgi:hypothetical protein